MCVCVCNVQYVPVCIYVSLIYFFSALELFCKCEVLVLQSQTVNLFCVFLFPSNICMSYICKNTVCFHLLASAILHLLVV